MQTVRTIPDPKVQEVRKLDAQITKLQVTPAHFDKFGEIDRDEYATVTIKVPMDSQEAKDWITGLFAHLSREYVKVEVTDPQMDLPSMSSLEAKTATRSASLTAEDVDKQLQTAKGITELA